MTDIPAAEPETHPPADSEEKKKPEFEHSAFLNEEEFQPPADAEVKGAAEMSGGPRRGRRPLTPEDKAARQATRDMGDLFGDDPPPEAEPKEPGANGAPPVSEMPDATKGKRSKRMDKQSTEALAEIICLNQYALFGMFFDPMEANPIARYKKRDGEREILDYVHPQGPEMHARLKLAWAQYLESKDVSQVSPGVVLALTNIGYASAVISQPKSSQKLRGYLGKIKDWFGSFRNK